MRWMEQLETRVGTPTAAARELHARWKRKEPKAAKQIGVPALASRIAKLHKQGDSTGWWEARPLLAELFADLLELSLDDIFGGPTSHADSVAFPEFPGLPPLRAGERPCAWPGTPALLAVERCLPRGDGPTWITVPAGCGKSLVVRFLSAQRSNDVATISVARLREAMTLRGTQLPLVIDVDAADPVNDLECAIAIADRAAATVVLAPYPCPDAMWSAASERVSLREGGWIEVDAAPVHGWRETLLAWIDARLDDTETKLVKDDVTAWLRRNDPDERIIATPGDLLALCSDFDVHGDSNEPLVVRARRWLDETSPKLFPAETPPAWKRHAAVETYHRLAQRQFREVAEPLHEHGREQWAALVPTSTRPADEAAAPGACLVVGYMSEAGLLRGSGGALELYPSWVARALAVDGLRIDASRCTEWGALAADESRQSAIDDLLDALPEPAFRRLVAGIAKHNLHENLATLAALEAALAAVARRLADTRLVLKDADVAGVHELMRRQLGAFVRADEDGPARRPFTRPRRDEWLATAWAVSLSCPRPSWFSEQEWAWELPGWAARLTLDGLGRRELASSTTTPWSASTSVRRLAALAVKVVTHLRSGDVPLDVPRLLLPALLLSGAGWNLRPRHLQRLGGTWDEHFLAQLAAAASIEERARVAREIWRLCDDPDSGDGSPPVAERLARLREQHLPLFELVATNIAAAEVAEVAATSGIHRRATGAMSFVETDPRELLRLPSAVRVEALRSWLAGAVKRAARFDEARELLPLLEVDDLDLAIELARAEDGQIAAEFTSFVWDVDPQRALEETRRALDLGLASTPGWFHTAPRAVLPALADLIGRVEPRAGWVARWAASRVLEAGAAAEVLFRLARGSLGSS